jgi:hypothetical protein
LPQGAALLAVLSMAAYASGFLKARAVAQAFGATLEHDAFIAAAKIPELAFDVLVVSGLTAPFIPIFARLRRDDAGAATAFAQTVLSVALLVISIAVAIFAFVAPLSAPILVPGFDAAGQSLYVDLFRIMAITQVFFAGSIVLGEILVADRRFLFYGLAPILYNLGIAGGVVLLGSSLGIHAAAVGAVAGSMLHLGIRAVGIRGTTFRPRIRFRVRTAAFREFIRLMLPKMVSQPLEPLLSIAFTRVAHIRNTGPTGSTRLQTYVPHTQLPPVSMSFVMRTNLAPAAIMPGVRAAMRTVAPELPIFGESTLEAMFASNIATPRLTSMLLGTFASLALVLAAVGLYSVLSFKVGQRTREIGIRVALGAHPGAVMKLIVRHGLILASAGMAIGLIAALGLTQLLTRVLYAVSPVDPLNLTAVALVVGTIAAIACWLPARRAARVDPIQALRAE